MPGPLQPKQKPFKGLVTFSKRTAAMGSSGWEGYTVGFTLVGGILGGAGLGWLLDQHFGTTYWLPVLFLAGAVLGFREMFLQLGRINKTEALERKRAVEKKESTQQEKVTDTEPGKTYDSRVPPPPFINESPGADNKNGDPQNR